MDLEREQLADLIWARQVFNDMGDDRDEPGHAIWITEQIALHANNQEIRDLAKNLLTRAQNRCYLNENTFCFLRAQQGKA